MIVRIIVILLDQQIFADLTKHTVQVTQNIQVNLTQNLHALLTL